MQPLSLRRPGAAWAAVALALLLGTLLSQVMNAASSFEWQPGALITQPWRAWSAAFVHYSALHLIGNLTGLALTAAFGGVSRVPASDAAAWLAAWPLTHLAFLFAAPDLLHYGGLSGVVHAGVAIVLAHLFVHGAPGQRWVATAVLAGLIAKIATETPWRGSVQQLEGWDIGIAPIAHVTGVAAGTACYLAAWAWRRSRSRTHV